MVREPDTKGQGSGQQGRMMEGCWVGQGAKLSLVLAAVKALMQMGHGDLGLFLSLDLSALLCCASAPSLALCYPCHLCLDTVGLSPCVCVCMSHSSNMRPRRGSLGEVCEVNQGDLLFQGGGQPVASHKVFTSRSWKDDTTPKPRMGILQFSLFLSDWNFNYKWAVRFDPPFF